VKGSALPIANTYANISKEKDIAVLAEEEESFGERMTSS